MTHAHQFTVLVTSDVVKDLRFEDKDLWFEEKEKDKDLRLEDKDKDKDL